MSTTLAPPASPGVPELQPCARCGVRLAAGARFCPQCGAAVEQSTGEADASPARLPAGTVVWEQRIAIVNNRFLLWDLLRVVGITAVLMEVLLAAVSLLVGEGLFFIPPLILVLGAAGIYALFVLTGLVAFANRFDATFVVAPEAVVYESGRRERSVTRVAFWAGVLTLNPRLTGASLVAASRESTVVAWKDVHRVRVHRGARVISLADAWHTVLRLHCTPENFAEVEARVREYAAAGAAARLAYPSGVSGPRVVGAYGGWVALCVLGAALAQQWFYTQDDTELLVLLAVALLLGVCLVGRFGWVLALPAGLLALLAFGVVVAEGLTLTESLFGGGMYRQYELDEPAFWASASGSGTLVLLSALTVAGLGPFRWSGLRRAAEREAQSDWEGGG